MTRYRRNFIPGGRYFFTVMLLGRASRLLIERIDELHTVFVLVRAECPFEIDAIVVLPDHLLASGYCRPAMQATLYDGANTNNSTKSCINT